MTDEQLQSQFANIRTGVFILLVFQFVCFALLALTIAETQISLNKKIDAKCMEQSK